MSEASAEALPEGGTESEGTESTGEESQTDAGKPALGEGSTDSKPEGETGEGGESSKTDEPIEYTDFSMPEGVSLDEELLGNATPLFQEAGLSQEMAQKFVDFYSGIRAGETQAQESAIADQISSWGEQAKADTEFGGEKFDENIAQALRALDKFGTPELRKVLDETGLGNHPEVIRLAFRVGATVTEDRPEGDSAASAATPKTRSETLYPDS